MDTKKISTVYYKWRAIFEYHPYGFFTCKLIRDMTYGKSTELPIEAVGSSADDAFDKAKELMERIEAIRGINPDWVKAPLIEKKIDNKNEFLYIDSNELIGLPFIHPNSKVQICFQYKDKEGKIFITDISQKSNDGFFIVDKPYPLSEANGKIEKTNDIHTTLQDGEELYSYNDMGFLSGSAGLLVVKDGMVIRTQTLMMA